MSLASSSLDATSLRTIRFSSSAHHRLAGASRENICVLHRDWKVIPTRFTACTHFPAHTIGMLEVKAPKGGPLQILLCHSSPPRLTVARLVPSRDKVGNLLISLGINEVLKLLGLVSKLVQHKMLVKRC